MLLGGGQMGHSAGGTTGAAALRVVAAMLHAGRGAGADTAAAGAAHRGGAAGVATQMPDTAGWEHPAQRVPWWKRI